MQVCEHPLQRHLMGCILKQEDESVASGRFRMRVAASLARDITGAFGGTVSVRFWSVNLCFVLNNIISLSPAFVFFPPLFLFSSFIRFYLCQVQTENDISMVCFVLCMFDIHTQHPSIVIGEMKRIAKLVSAVPAQVNGPLIVYDGNYPFKKDCFDPSELIFH